jgi:hypothetical protein
VFAPMFLERTLQFFFWEDRKSRSSDCFPVLTSSSVHRFDLTFAYDVISILHILVVLFVFFSLKKKLGKFARFFFSWPIRYCMYLRLISQFCEH